MLCLLDTPRYPFIPTGFYFRNLHLMRTISGRYCLPATICCCPRAALDRQQRRIFLIRYLSGNYPGSLFPGVGTWKYRKNFRGEEWTNSATGDWFCESDVVVELDGCFLIINFPVPTAVVLPHEDTEIFP